MEVYVARYLCLFVGFEFFVVLTMCRDVFILGVSGGHLAPPDCRLQVGDWLGFSSVRLKFSGFGL